MKILVEAALASKKGFPILGGRLLKKEFIVSLFHQEEFPILGGRLLKHPAGNFILQPSKVSNPWREAIEERFLKMQQNLNLVSNPWREAIEV